jgi:hypothetical protein
VPLAEKKCLPIEDTGSKEFTGQPDPAKNSINHLAGSGFTQQRRMSSTAPQR